MRGIAVLIALAVLASGSAAWAEKYPLPRPDLPAIADENLPPRPPGKGWRRVTNFGGHTDSTCIGNPKSPQCALDTRFACSARSDRILCFIAHYNMRDDTPEFMPRVRRWPTVGYIIDYRILNSLPYRRFTLPPDFYFRQPVKHSDLVVILQERRCYAHTSVDGPPEAWTCSDLHPSDRWHHALRRVGRLWQVVAIE